MDGEESKKVDVCIFFNYSVTHVRDKLYLLYYSILCATNFNYLLLKTIERKSHILTFHPLIPMFQDYDNDKMNFIISVIVL